MRRQLVMIRQGLGPSDAYADALVHADGLTSLQYREKESSETQEVRAEATAPKFLRLDRRGNTSRYSWLMPTGTSRAWAPPQLHDPVYVGLAVCSHDAEALQTAIFRDVKLKGQTPRP